jgi:hypothetical protein
MTAVIVDLVPLKPPYIIKKIMLRRVALVRTGVSEELSASVIRMTRLGELGITLAVTSNRLRISS